MKKTLIALLLVGSSSALFAQNRQTTTNNTNTNTTTNSTNTDMNSSLNASPSNDPGAPSQFNTNANINTDAGINTNANLKTSSNSNQSNTVNPNAVNNRATPNADMNTSSYNSNMTSSANMSNTNSFSTGSYKAYGTVATDVPSTVRYSFQKEQPNVTGAQWYQTPTGQLRVMYKDANNQDMDLYYYGSSAQSYTISLPLRQSLTSDDVLEKARNMFGLAVYDINRVKAANMEDVYHVRLLDNGQVRSVWIDEHGSEVAAADVFRSAGVAENDVINEVNTAPASDASNNNTTNSANHMNNTNTKSTTTTNSSNSTNNSSSPSTIYSTTTDATNSANGNPANNANGNRKTTNESASDNTTTIPSTNTETK